ncbi:DNA-binding MarR family transcriptional regulator [Anaerospora hongkongensis]|uniref:DNA-binding MarR family transcriptional regulator n=2 Tax=Anaerospora hongkongensis TaxID=244830 RepID=A0A4R1Q0A6_9FIRM|nr:DNA-binding MarR family transcriptional regulator [Anaerospora hongkongensis]
MLFNNVIMNENNGKKFMEIMKRIVTKTHELSKHASESTPAGNLSSSEVSLIILIGQHENLKVTDLAARYGATKGAISTMVKNLVNKGLVRKCRSSENEREVLLSLTELGVSVYEEKERHSQNLYQDIDDHLGILTPGQVNSLFKMLHALEAHIDEHIEEHLRDLK